VVHNAATEMNPAEIANYCLDVAKLFNQFYHESPILKAEGAVRDFRLGITDLTASTLKTALDLLGIDVPERM
jgi:arginyl-tRNA synthetase